MQERGAKRLRLMRFLCVICVIGLLLATGACTAEAVQDPVAVGAGSPDPVNDRIFRVATVAEGLQNPWSIAFLPSGEILITERPGRLRIVRSGVLDPRPVEGVPEVRGRGQGGLMDVLPHPDFESNHLLYMSISKPRDAGREGTTAVIRGRFEGGRLRDVEQIFEAQAWTTSVVHLGSRLMFDSERHLFVTVGDAGVDPDLLARHPAQDRSNHFGTIVRLHDDGRVPADNPFVGRTPFLPEIWSFGHRSLLGLALDPYTGNIWESESGPQAGDEINLIEGGRNYGWPVIGYGVNYGTARVPIHHGSARDGMEQPRAYWIESVAPSGLMVYTGDEFSTWQGDLFAGSLAGERLIRLTLEGDRVVEQHVVLDDLGRIRDVREGPDGLIYVAIDSQSGGLTRVLRLEPGE